MIVTWIAIAGVFIVDDINMIGFEYSDKKNLRLSD